MLIGCDKNGTPANENRDNANAEAPVQIGTDWREVCANNTEMCDEAKQVRVRGKNGFVTVNAGESKFVELAAYTGEMHYECAGMDKTVRCGTEFTAVNISRSSGTGQLNVQFYVKN